jgi:hypothetical protein
MVALALGRGVSVATLVAPAEPSTVHLHAVAASLGLCGALWQVGVAASIPHLVPRRRVVAANGLVWSTAALAVAAGPALGGELVSTLGAETAIAVVAAGFATSAALVARSRLGVGAESSGGLQDLAEAARYASPSALLRGALMSAGLLLLATAGRWSHPFLYIVDGAGAARQAAVLLGGAAIFGSVLGAAGAPAHARRWSRDRLLAYGVVAAGTLVAASQWAAPASGAGLWILAGAAAGLVLVGYQSLLQEQTPDLVRGRVLGVATAVLHSAALGGVALEAWIAGLVGAGALAASTGLLFVAALAGVVLIGAPRAAPAPVQGGRIAPSAS